MKKKQYISPVLEITPIESCRIMDSSMTFLPPQVGAPARRAGEIPCDTI